MNISPTNFLSLPLSFVYSILEFHLHSSSICTPFDLCFHLCYDISNFVGISFPFFYKNSVMKSGLTCPLAIWSKLCTTFGCNNRENVALVCTLQRLMTTFTFSNNLHCINNICKVVHLVMVLIGMNCYCGRPKG